MRLWFLALVGVALAFATAVEGAAVPLATLSLQARQTTAPAATLVQVGRRSLTLGQLRAAHAAREASLVRARSAGLQAAGTLRTGTPVAVHGVRAGGVVRPPIGAVLASTLVVEPPSQYAAAPADMKAFCAAASASACLYLPPGQQVQQWTASLIADFDVLIDQSQCGEEGGAWGGMFGGPAMCAFYYPSSVVVHFDPAANFQVSSTADCASAIWSYQADARGAVAITLLPRYGANAPFTTGASAACVVRVTAG